MPEPVGIFRLAARLSASLTASLSLVLPLPAMAQGDLLVAPTRVVLNGGGSAEVILSNIGATPATYRIGIELRRMGPDGALEDVSEADATPAERAALDMIRFTPRQRLLPPNQPQSVRIMARPPAELPDGEYRVHMSFRALPATTSVEAPQDPNAKGLSIKLTPIYGVTIPVIFRKGQLKGGATISNPVLFREGPSTFLKLDLSRTGDRSVYGEIRVLAPGVKEPVLFVRGIAVYPELTGRTVRVPMSQQQAAALKGPFKIEYREHPESGGQLIASVPANF